MSSSSSSKAIVAVALAGLSVGGCFRPLYGGAAGQDLRAAMTAIEIEPIPDRIGHYLRSELTFNLDGSGAANPKRYKLVIKVDEKLASPIVDTSTGRAQTGNLTTEAKYKLTVIESGATVTEGTAIAVATYDRSPQRFAAVRAARDAEIRIANELAEQIKTRLALALAPRP